MARPAKPTALKLVSGNPGKRPLNLNEPKPGDAPTRPTAMTATAKKIWAKLVHSMPAGVFTSADTYLLSAYCEAVSSHQLSTKMLMESEHETKGSTGQQKLNPWFRQQADSARLIVTIGAKLGLDPVSRQQISTAPQTATDGFDDLIS